MSTNDQKREQYEQSLRGIVEAMHGLAIAFEAASAAAREWDPDGKNDGVPDPVAHATITSCRALMASIVSRHAGAGQMLGLDRSHDAVSPKAPPTPPVWMIPKKTAS